MGKFTMTREFYIKKGSRKVADKQSSAVAYLYEMDGKPYAMCFVGRQAKPYWHHRFQSEAKRESHIVQTFERVREAESGHAKRKEERKAARSKPHTLEVGHILYTSWGYEQTNIDFYQVTRLVGQNSVEIRKVGKIMGEATSWASGTCLPAPDSFVGEPMVKRVNGSDNSIRIESFAHAHVWDGKPKHYSSWH